MFAFVLRPQIDLEIKCSSIILLSLYNALRMKEEINLNSRSTGYFVESES